MICSTISTCHGHESPFGPVPDCNGGSFSFVTPDAETSTSEEPGARKRHAGICAGAVWATGRPTAMADETGTRSPSSGRDSIAFMRLIEARYEKGLLKPTEPLALLPGESVNLIVVRRADPKR